MNTHRKRNWHLGLCGILAGSLLTAATGKSVTAGADFGNFDARAKEGEKLNVVFFGGSLTWGAQATDPQLTSYRAQMARHLENRYPKAHFHFFDAAVGGTGSQLGAFRLQRDVLNRKPDLVFLDFTVNDGAFDPPDTDKLASYESLVRRMISTGIPVEQVIFPVKADLLPNPPSRMLDLKHKEIAQAYHVPVADDVSYLRGLAAAHEADPAKLWTVADDPTHPGDEAYALYADGAWTTFEQATRDSVREIAPDKMLHDETYMVINRALLGELGPLPSGWTKELPSRIAITYDFLPSRWLDSVVMATGNEPAGVFHFDVKAKNVFLFGEVGPKSGKYEVIIDGGASKTYDLTMAGKGGNLRYWEMIAQGLDASKVHHIELTPRLALGQEIRLESICLAGAPATVTVGSR